MRHVPTALPRSLTLVILTTLFCLGGRGAAAETLHFDSGPRQVTLIELYTSQGCSSCPPAERWLAQLKSDPRLWHSLVPVAFHVDYWDYIGWRDTLADAAYSQRQRRYHGEGKLSAVYTPAFVVNGEEWRNWFGLRRLPEGDSEPGNLAVQLGNGQLQARFSPSPAERMPLTLNITVLGVGLEAAITAGENSGRTLRQDFVVLMHRQQRSDTGVWEIPLALPPRPEGGRLALAAWVSRPGMQTPLQATGGWLPKNRTPETGRAHRP